ncbi:MAG TPA: glycoside hydrolase family 66 protein [Intrasporangium sp.]|uniref:glycoside hydrolase family 66 protein n=1 Tax=Intrasporangium sp. TaxID=1925024 RepID=UPI002D78BA2A|nr:glycoside hydrolase family 66 protein [Intrasporangium sp.]HET7397862.1 glycoside hydrolase family 66 protein [Intrasporangium sp.]
MTHLDARVRRADLRPGAEVTLVVDAPTSGTATLVVTHLGEQVREVTAALGVGRQPVALGAFPEGGYAVTVGLAGQEATTAFDVLADRNARPRYGFVADFGAGRADAAAVAESLAAFSITHVQFYDWMYRHAELLPPEDDFVDALGRPLSLRTVRALLDAVHDVGAQALAYAAVYGAGRDYVADHPDEVLHRRGGEPWTLGGFLWVMDVSRGSTWVRHLVEQVRDACATMGFDGLHLDQYGDPKLAVTTAGAVVDLAEELPALIDAVRDALPGATLIFNNVNDFPTRTTARARQDATYVEVWPPHVEHADLVDLVRAARDVAPGRAPILAAYLEPLGSGSGERELAAAKLALSTVWAAGGQYLLFGERHGALVDPYYPNFATLDDEAVRTLRAFTDFSVANGDLLFDPGLRETTGSLALGANEDVVVAGAPVSTRPEAGAVWVRTSEAGRRLVVQLVDYRAQEDGRWNAPRMPTGTVSGVTVRVRVASAAASAVFGHPLGGPHLTPLELRDEGDYVTALLPDFDTWGTLSILR